MIFAPRPSRIGWTMEGSLSSFQSGTFGSVLANGTVAVDSGAESVEDATNVSVPDATAEAVTTDADDAEIGANDAEADADSTPELAAGAQ